MTSQTQKLELIQWIIELKNARLLSEVSALKKQTEQSSIVFKRTFGCGKEVIIDIAEDFNAPLEDFKEYMP